MVGRLLTFWEGNFSGAMLNFGGVFSNSTGIPRGCGNLNNQELVSFLLAKFVGSYSYLGRYTSLSVKKNVVPVALTNISNIIFLASHFSKYCQEHFANPAACYWETKSPQLPISSGYYSLVNLHSNGIPPFLLGNTSSKGPFSIAMLDYRSVFSITALRIQAVSACHTSWCLGIS